MPQSPVTHHDRTPRLSPGALRASPGKATLRRILADGRRTGLALAALHLAVAFAAYCQGLSFAVDPERCQWDYFWQAIPAVDLLGHPWQSFWHLHAQPPGFSLWGLAWLKFLGPAHFPASLQLGYALLGAAVVALTYGLARALLASPGWALAAGLGMALNPALFYYESYLLYEPLVIFLVTGSAWSLWRARQTGSGRWLAAFAVALNALVLTRTVYHLVFLVGALAFAWPLWRAMSRRRRAALLGLALLAPVLWYAKNAAQYGFFGPSSWHGLGLFKCASSAYTPNELLALRKAGAITEMVEQDPPYQFRPRAYVRYGFSRTSAVPLLARNDFHNINVPAISRAYGEEARRLIRHDPWRYAVAIHRSYQKFCQPPSRFIHLDYQRAAAIGWEPLVADWLYGVAVTRAIEIPTHIELGSLFYFYFPLLMGGGAWWARARRREGRTRPAAARRAALMAYFLYVCLYVAVVGCMMENGENMRFRFATEPLTLIIALLGIRGAWRRWIRPAAARFRLR